MTPLEYLKNKRKEVGVQEPIKEIHQKLKDEWKKVIESKLNEDLINAIDLKPMNSVWFVGIVCKLKYKQVFPSNTDFLNYINTEINLPDGFELHYPLSIRYNEQLKFNSVLVILKEKNVEV